MRKAVRNQNEQFIKNSLENVKPADISALLEELSSDDSKYVIDVLEKDVGAEIITELEDNTRERFLKNFESYEIAQYVEHLDSDDAADVLNEFPLKTREEVIANVEDEKHAEHILDLLRYDDDVAGGLMAKELIQANENWSIVQTIDEIRRQKDDVEKIYSVYVVDENHKLLGRVALKKVILSSDQVLIKDIYESDIVSVPTYMPEEEVAAIMRKYDLDAVPVINVQGKLVGRITIDDVLDVVTEQAEEDMQAMAGISDDVEEDDSVWRISRARLPWLIIGMFGGLLGAKFIGFFEKDIALIPAMAFFIPLITATGGNVGIQSSSIIVQSLANPSAFTEKGIKRYLKIFLVAVFNGSVLALIVFGANLIFGEAQELALVVSIALFSVVLLASFMGTITPLILDRFGVNPAVASGPFITTANDLIGLSIYFLVAHYLYSF
ncbi:MAG: magnesium transporter [Bacteroidota bacterium]